MQIKRLQKLSKSRVFDGWKSVKEDTNYELLRIIGVNGER